MVNVARGEEIVYPPPETGDGSESESEPVATSTDESRSDDRGAEEIAAPSQESEIDVDEACHVVAREMYSGGLHHMEVAEKYGVPVEVVKWVMKEYGIGLYSRDMGEPPTRYGDSLVRIVRLSNTAPDFV